MTNPLGLTPEQESQSAIAQFLPDIQARMKANRELIESLPPGTRIQLLGWGGPYPEMDREHALEMFG